MYERTNVPELVVDPALEAAVQERGRELLAGLRRAGGEALRRDAVTDRVTRWAMGDPALKTQLFRFIDVLPTLHSNAEVARHLREYLLRPDIHLPAGSAGMLRASAHNGAVAAVVARTARIAAHQMARRFIAGSNVREAAATIRRLRGQGMGFTLDILGEAVRSEAEAAAYQQAYLELLGALAAEAKAWPAVGEAPYGPLPAVNVSLKLSSLYSQFDPLDAEGTAAAVKDRLRPILAAARRHGAYVHVDMEQYAFKEITLRIFQEILMEPEFADWSDAGIVIQAYLRESADDLEVLRAWAERRGAPVWVRLVKGAYWDYETVIAAQKQWPVPVFTRKWETDAAFERQTLFLMRNHRLLRPAIGSHNIRSVAHALALAEHLGLPQRTVEYQVLYGMGDRLGLALAQRGEGVRVYVPYGELLPGISYLVRRLLENTSNESFLRHSFAEGVPDEALLANPALEPAAAPASSGLRVLGPAPEKPAAPPRPLLRPEVPELPPFVNEPETDFSLAGNRARMSEAIASVRSRLGRHFPLVIDGREVKMPAVLSRPNPSHVAELVGTVSAAGPAEAERAVAAARAAFPAWRDTPAAERAALLFRTAGILRRRRFELAAWEVLEVGKPWRESDADVAEAIDFLEYYGREMLRLANPRRRDIPGETNEYFYEPRGVAVVIAPWNFPLAILTGMTSAALVAGNTVIMKPAEQSSIIAAQLMSAFHDAGVPAGVLHFLPGRGEEVGPTLVEHPDVALIAFTGSKEVGLKINADAAVVRPGQRDVKRVIAEMGGKNAIIIDDDADLDEAVPGVLASGFGYQGQKCSACSRIIVLDGIYDAFIGRLAEAARSLKIGRAEEPGTMVGPVVDEEARLRILRYLAKGSEEGQTLVSLNPGELAEEGFFVAPTIFTGVSPDACIAQEEIFGPVMAVLRAKDLDEALRVADCTLYALTGGLYSRSPANIERVRREFRVGNLYINRKITGAQVDRQPFGGFRLSGIGSKAGGPDYLPQFLLPRTVTEATLRRGFAPDEPTAR